MITNQSSDGNVGKADRHVNEQDSSADVTNSIIVKSCCLLNKNVVSRLRM